MWSVLICTHVMNSCDVNGLCCRSAALKKLLVALLCSCLRLCYSKLKLLFVWMGDIFYYELAVKDSIMIPRNIHIIEGHNIYHSHSSSWLRPTGSPLSWIKCLFLIFQLLPNQLDVYTTGKQTARLMSSPRNRKWVFFRQKWSNQGAWCWTKCGLGPIQVKYLFSWGSRV